jgi:hypothetical protein
VREAEESPLLEAVSRQLLVKILRAGKDLLCALVNSKACKLSVITCLSVQVVNKYIHHSKPRL